MNEYESYEPSGTLGESYKPSKILFRAVEAYVRQERRKSLLKKLSESNSLMYQKWLERLER